MQKLSMILALSFLAACSAQPGSSLKDQSVNNDDARHQFNGSFAHTNYLTSEQFTDTHNASQSATYIVSALSDFDSVPLKSGDDFLLGLKINSDVFVGNVVPKSAMAILKAHIRPESWAVACAPTCTATVDLALSLQNGVNQVGDMQLAFASNFSSGPSGTPPPDGAAVLAAAKAELAQQLGNFGDMSFAVWHLCDGPLEAACSVQVVTHIDAQGQTTGQINIIDRTPPVLTAASRAAGAGAAHNVLTLGLTDLAPEATITATTRIGVNGAAVATACAAGTTITCAVAGLSDDQVLIIERLTINGAAGQVWTFDRDGQVFKGTTVPAVLTLF